MSKSKPIARVRARLLAKDQKNGKSVITYSVTHLDAKSYTSDDSLITKRIGKAVGTLFSLLIQEGIDESDISVNFTIRKK